MTRSGTSNSPRRWFSNSLLTHGETFWQKPPNLLCRNLRFLSLSEGSAITLFCPVWVPTHPLNFFFPSPLLSLKYHLDHFTCQSNCSRHPWSKIQCVSLLMSSELFILSPNARLLTFLHIFALPLALIEHAIITYDTFCDRYPHEQHEFYISRTFLPCKYDRRPNCPLLVSIAALLGAIFRSFDISYMKLIVVACTFYFILQRR